MVCSSKNLISIGETESTLALVFLIDDVINCLVEHPVTYFRLSNRRSIYRYTVSCSKYLIAIIIIY